MKKTAKEVISKEMSFANSEGKTVEELKEIAQTLQAQVNHHQVMATKSQGALEVVLQMIPKEEVAEMLVQETKANGEMVDDAKTAD